MLSRLSSAALARPRIERNTRISSRNDSPMTAATKTASGRSTRSATSGMIAVSTADVRQGRRAPRARPAAPRRAGARSWRGSPCPGARWWGGDDGRDTGAGVDLGTRDRCDARVARRGPRAGARRRPASRADVHRDQQRAVRAGAEARGDEVVGAAARCATRGSVPSSGVPRLSESTGIAARPAGRGSPPSRYARRVPVTCVAHRSAGATRGRP